MDETWNYQIYKRLKFETGQTEQINTCSKFTIEVLEEGGKYVQS